MTESLPADEDRLMTGSLPGQLILQAAQQTMREMREEQINDLDTALQKLADERNRYTSLFPSLFTFVSLSFSLAASNTDKKIKNTHRCEYFSDVSMQSMKLYNLDA